MTRKRKRAIELYKKGMSISAISKELEVPPMMLRGWLPGETNHPQFEKMAAMRKQGMTNVQIAEATGVTRARVGHVLGPVRSPYRSTDRVTMRVPQELVEPLISQAESMGLQPGKSTDKYAQITRMLREIADGRMAVSWKEGHGPYTYLAEGTG